MSSKGNENSGGKTTVETDGKVNSSGGHKAEVRVERDFGNGTSVGAHVGNQREGNRGKTDTYVGVTARIRF